jgi:hypothetical protein
VALKSKNLVTKMLADFYEEECKKFDRRVEDFTLMLRVLEHVDKAV